MSSASIGADTPALELDLAGIPAPLEQRAVLGRSFGWLWGATAASNLSDGIRMAALPLMAATLTTDAALVAGVHAASLLPWLLFGLPAGVLVDRMDRRRLLLMTHTLRVGVVAIVAFAAVTGSVTIGLLYAVAVVLGAAETVFDNAAQALLPSVVDERSLERANGRLEVAYLGGNQLIGPALGAALFAASTSAPFFLDTAALVVTTLAVAFIRVPPATVARPVRTSLRRDVAEGLRWLWANRPVRALTLLGTGINFCVNATIAIMVLYALQILGVGKGAYGLLLVAYAVGGIGGGVLAPRIARALGRRRTVTGCVFCAGVVLAGMGLVAGAPVAAVLFAVLGAVATVWNVVTLSLRQSLTPDALLGRVIGGHRLLSWGGGALGALAGGFLARAVGVAPTFVAAGIAAILLGLMAMRLLADLPEPG